VNCRWIRALEQGGKVAIKLKKRGRASGERRILTPGQEDALRNLLIDNNPKQLKLKFALWNRKTIKAVVYQMSMVKIAIRTIGD
jgi:hypothetical protein